MVYNVPYLISSQIYAQFLRILNLLFLLFTYPLVYLLMVQKSLKIIFREKSVKYLFYSILFSLVAYHGRFIGMVGRVFGGKKVK